MKKLKIVTGLLLLVGLWTILIWKNPLGTQLNRMHSSFIYALYSETEADKTGRWTAKKDVSATYLYELIVIENCEYMKNLNGPPPAANTNYVHKGNCTNSIHPDNMLDWQKMYKLLNSPMLENILK